MDSEVREAILSRVGLAGLVGHYVELSPAGPGRFRGLSEYECLRLPPPLQTTGEARRPSLRS